MLQACMIDFGVIWDTPLTLEEFAYNNSNHSSTKMAPFEAFYDRKCRSLIGWFNLVEIYSLDTNFLRDSM